MDEIDRLQADNDEMKGYVERYHTADKRAAIAEEKLEKDRKNEVLFAVSLATGAALIGLSPTGWAAQPLGWLLILFGGVLIIGASIARFWK